MTTVPDWLARHGGSLKPVANGPGYYVYFDREPQYFILPRPAAGRYACEVAQSINGKRFEKNRTYATAEEAVRGGLEDLREALGW
jgi:hypothetical protein